MNDLRKSIRQCTKCPLHLDMPGTCPVPGVGNTKANIVIVGEALGKDESLLEEPFVGECGKFLDGLLDKSGLIREQLFITNTVKCRPTKTSKKGSVSNRPPTADEVTKCKSWLWKELTTVAPRVILTLGKVPTGTLLSAHLKKSFKLGTIVGKEFTVDYTTAKIIPLYHPSFLMVHGRKHTEECITILERIKHEHA